MSGLDFIRLSLNERHGWVTRGKAEESDLSPQLEVHEALILGYWPGSCPLLDVVVLVAFNVVCHLKIV